MSAPRLSDAEHRQLDHEIRSSSCRESSSDRQRTEELLERIADLEDRLHLRGILLESARELLDRRVVEIASLRNLIRMQVAMNAMDRELETVAA